MWLGWVTYKTAGNEILVDVTMAASWSAAEALTAKPSDVFRVQLGAGAKAGLWAIWSEQVSGNWDLYGRQRRGDSWGPGTADGRRRNRTFITRWHPTPQETCGWSGKVFETGSLIFSRAGMTVTAGPLPSNCHLRLRTTGRRRSRAIGKAGCMSPGTPMTRETMTLSCGASKNARWGDQAGIATSLKFEAKVSLACDNANRLWAAWNESGLQWGKDTGVLLRRRRLRFIVSDSLRPLYCRTASGWSRQPDWKHPFLLS